MIGEKTGVVTKDRRLTLLNTGEMRRREELDNGRERRQEVFIVKTREREREWFSSIANLHGSVRFIGSVSFL